jgi:hypothetical protein
MKSILLFSALISATAIAANEGMPNMPKVNAKRVYMVKSQEEGETLLDDRGFGEKEPEVKMMNLMMVEGSGYEGMDMAGMKLSKNDKGTPSMDMSGSGKNEASSAEGAHSYEVKQTIKPNPPKPGVNTIEFLVNDKSGKPAKGLKIKSEVKMTSMDMGTENPKVKEIAPGKYQTKVSFTMQGPWAVTLTFPNGEQQTFNFNASK